MVAIIFNYSIHFVVEFVGLFMPIGRKTEAVVPATQAGDLQLGRNNDLGRLGLGSAQSSKHLSFARSLIDFTSLTESG